MQHMPDAIVQTTQTANDILYVPPGAVLFEQVLSSDFVGLKVGFVPVHPGTALVLAEVGGIAPDIAELCRKLLPPKAVMEKQVSDEDAREAVQRDGQHNAQSAGQATHDLPATERGARALKEMEQQELQQRKAAIVTPQVPVFQQPNSQDEAHHEGAAQKRMKKTQTAADPLKTEDKEAVRKLEEMVSNEQGGTSSTDPRKEAASRKAREEEEAKERLSKKKEQEEKEARKKKEEEQEQKKKKEAAKVAARLVEKKKQEEAEMAAKKAKEEGKRKKKEESKREGEEATKRAKAAEEAKRSQKDAEKKQNQEVVGKVEEASLC